MLPHRLSLGILLAGCVACPAAGQTFEGRVLDDRDDRPVGTALVRLLDEGGQERGLTVADTTGRYRLDVPSPGVYRIRAERIGYDDFGTLLLEAQKPEGRYPIDLLMRRSPVPILGLEVTAGHVDRQLDMIHAMVVVFPTESILYPTGGVLLFTEAWLR